MFCSQCGKEIAGNSKFCSECGKEIPSKEFQNISDNHTDFEKAKLSAERTKKSPKGDTTQKDKNFTIFSIKGAGIVFVVLIILSVVISLFSDYEQEEFYFDNTKTSYSSSIPRPTATPRTIWPTPNTWWLTPTTTNSNPSATFTPTPIPTPTSLDDLRAEIRKNAFVASDKYEGQKLAIVFQASHMREVILYHDDFNYGRYRGPAIVDYDDTTFYCLINNTNEVSDYQTGDFIEVKGRIKELNDFEIIVSPCEVKANN